MQKGCRGLRGAQRATGGLCWCWAPRTTPRASSTTPRAPTSCTRSSRVDSPEPASCSGLPAPGTLGRALDALHHRGPSARDAAPCTDAAFPGTRHLAPEPAQLAPDPKRGAPHRCPRPAATAGTTAPGWKIGPDQDVPAPGCGTTSMCLSQRRACREGVKSDFRQTARRVTGVLDT